MPLGNHGHVRTVIGDLVERLTARLVGGRRHKTQSTADYCPDVSATVAGAPVYYESKAAGKSRQTFVYAGRLRKDVDFAASHALWYVVWHHHAETKRAATVGGLESLVLAEMRAAFVVPFARFAEICRGRVEEPLNSKYGSSQDRPDTYGSGFRVPIKHLEHYEADGWKKVVEEFVREARLSSV